MLASNLRFFFHDFTPSVATGTQTFSIGMLGQVFYLCAMTAGQQPMDLFSGFDSFLSSSSV
jgi:hypothetical protein